MVSPYFKNKDFTLYQNDCIQTLNELPESSVDLIFADPPYFLSNGGISCSAGKMVSVNKANWDKSKGLEKDFEFTKSWLEASKRVLKENGTIWISGTMHNIYQVGFALQNLDYKILNEISWFKPNAPPNLSCRYFTHSHETLIWARKSKEAKHLFNYDYMKNWDYDVGGEGKQMRSVWSIPLTPQSEKVHGKHPTQKPLELLRRIIVSSSNKGDTVLDPFNGSGTTGVVAKELGRKYIGIDLEKDFLDLTLRRAAFKKEDLLIDKTLSITINSTTKRGD
ncbi:MAG: site-specific DNA-methyltransferase [Candidatus Diapherotrites archaeon]|jgi:site-specific DNA-methyltransferase (adenine-specific)|uniref:Type II methyltransferase n=1 Tax=Candidatus Iainarchaeum sp. TaxID=3101447 RepID=A0A7K4C079_9ARCH|nr:site-specific DNA-methyltransferase [Candidatus Diapherotrites archaeon]